MQLQTDSKTVFVELMSDLMWLVIQSNKYFCENRLEEYFINSITAVLLIEITKCMYMLGFYIIIIFDIWLQYY